MCSFRILISFLFCFISSVFFSGSQLLCIFIYVFLYYLAQYSSFSFPSILSSFLQPFSFFPTNIYDIIIYPFVLFSMAFIFQFSLSSSFFVVAAFLYFLLPTVILLSSFDSQYFLYLLVMFFILMLISITAFSFLLLFL